MAAVGTDSPGRANFYMSWILISGLSGAGKSVAAHALEDMGYYCTDNIPLSLLPRYLQTLRAEEPERVNYVAVVFDARSTAGGLEKISGVLDHLRAEGADPRIIYLEAEDEVLINRFKETRRKHPLSTEKRALSEAISKERVLLSPVRRLATVVLDTSATHIYQLRDMIREHVAPTSRQQFSVLLQSFGYKRGIPQDADVVFDARCLPNPYWKEELRSLTGKDEAVRQFLDAQPVAEKMLTSLRTFLEEWLPAFEENNRAYLSIAVGCTGGRHRSVYLVEMLARQLNATRGGVMVRHREL
jgi:UPF0042 nucleotide-binding protein